MLVVFDVKFELDCVLSVEKTSEKIEDACKFTSQLLKHGNAAEILSLKKVVSSQLQSIISHTPKPAVNFNLKFESTMSAFEKAVKVSLPFGFKPYVANPSAATAQ